MKWGNFRPINITLGLILLFSVFLAGCSQGTNNSNQGSSNSGQNFEELNLPLWERDLFEMEASKPNKPYKIAVALPQVMDNYWVAMAYGVLDEAERWGVEVVRLLEAGGYANLENQINQMNDLSQLDVDAILFAPVDYHATANVVEEITKKGIKIINIANLSASDDVIAAITYNDWQFGLNGADKIAELLGGKGNIVALNGPAGANWAEARVKAFNEQMKAKYPEIKILDQQISDLDRLEGQRIMDDWIQRFGDDIDGVYSVYSAMAEGAVVSLEGVGRAEEVKIVTSGGSTDSLKMLKENKIDWLSSEPGQLTGRWGVQYAIKALNGEPLNIPEKPANYPYDKPQQVATLPTIVYTPDSDPNQPYIYDWAPEGWTVPNIR